MSASEGSSEPSIRVLPDPESLARHAARALAEEIRDAISVRGECVAALPGGATPQEALELLVGESRVDWARTVVFPGDERMVPVSDSRSNEGLLRRALVDRIKGDRPMVLSWGIEPGLGPETITQRFEAQLLGVVPYVEGRPQLDILALGMGADGHTASLFPGRAYPDEAVVLATTDPDGQRRLSLGPLVLRWARRTHFLVDGEAKAQILAEVVKGPYDPVRWPAQLVARNSPRCEIWCDAAAASQLAAGAL
ncbi:MAG TPA: 6-phosphogluconolactonase [Candidatus Nanopelagicaceae bacterium]|nr:6-phosphogluconolactonase [Candidatus Nanopelagicaceae bacterium]